MAINYTYCDDHFTIYTTIESLCCTPEANIMLYVNYTSILKITHTHKIFDTILIDHQRNKGI